MSLHLRTTGAPTDHPEYNDAGATMNFTQTSVGHFVSEPFVLVADEDDDALPVGPNLVADGDAGDRTFIAYPGGKLVIEGAALSQPIEVPIEKSLKELTPNFIVLDPTTDNSAASAAIVRIPNQLSRM